MCIVTLHTKNHPKYKLIVATNRDEFYGRPTEKASFWKDEPYILGGRDLKQMGTWLGMTKSGRIAFLTNYRNPEEETSEKKSRGLIVKQFLMSKDDPISFLEQLRMHKKEYSGFNFIAGHVDQLFHYGNNEPNITPLQPGTHSFSNGMIDEVWPKTSKAKAALQHYVMNEENIDIETLFTQLRDDRLAADEDLPQTGIPLELERQVSPVFIKTPHYGTRSSTVILVTHANEVTFVERTFAQGTFADERRFDFDLSM